LGRNVVLKQQEETNDFEMGFNIDQVAQGWWEVRMLILKYTITVTHFTTLFFHVQVINLIIPNGQLKYKRHTSDVCYSQSINSVNSQNTYICDIWSEWFSKVYNGKKILHLTSYFIAILVIPWNNYLKTACQIMRISLCISYTKWMLQSTITHEPIHEVEGMQTVNNCTLQKHLHVLPRQYVWALGITKYLYFSHYPVS
jgi:hypothetical protein